MVDWELCNTRRLSIQGAITWHNGIGKYFEERYRTGIGNTLAYFDGKKTDFFFDREHHKEFNDVIDASLDEHEFVVSMIPEAMVFLQEKHDEIAYLLKDAESLSERALADLFEVFLDHYNDFYTRKWMAYRISGRIVKKMQEVLAERFPEEEVTRLVQLFSVPLVPNDVLQERIDLLKLALHGGSITEHADRYRHIPLFDVDHDPYLDEHFQKALEQVSDPQEELEEIQDSFSQRLKEYQKVMRELQPSKKLEKLIKMMKRAAFFRDHGDTIRQKVNLLTIPLYETIAEQLGVTRREACLLTNDEILHLLRHGKRFDAEELARRKQAFYLVQLGDQVEVFSGKEALEKGKNLHEVKGGQVKGITGVPGKVKGPACIIHTNLDLKKFKEGDVLVASMTRQDFVPYMRKAAAIVTDEGSVISHAAVIARELGVPCIVGTRNATHVLKDGEIVEVDAGKGIVIRA